MSDNHDMIDYSLSKSQLAELENQHRQLRELSDKHPKILEI